MVVCWSIQCRSFTGVIQCRSYTLSHTDHTLSHTPSFSHSPFEAIDWMIYFVIPETPSLTHLHSLSLILSLPWCPTITKCSLTTCALIHFHPSSTSHPTECSLTLSFSQSSHFTPLVPPITISWCPLLVLSSLSLIHKSSHMVSYHSSCYPCSSH